MPVPIVREIDDALKELVQWRINDARESRTVSREEAAGSTIDWDRYPVEAQRHIYKLLLILREGRPGKLAAGVKIPPLVQNQPSRSTMGRIR